jgi:DNA-binding NarL/FixJ family response regulator
VTKILIVDDHGIARDGLRALFDNHATFQVAGEASNGREAVKMTRDLCPDVVLMDVLMPELNGIEATRQILASQPEVMVIAITIQTGAEVANQMVEAGARGYLPKNGDSEELMLAISKVLDGELYLSPRINGGKEEEAPNKPDSSAFRVLTSREREVVQLLAEGKTTKEIATHLNMGVKTVETHRFRVLNKLGVNSMAELTKYAVREGLTSLDL